MTTHNSIIKNGLFSLICMVVFVPFSQAQNSKNNKAAIIKNMLDSQNFVFVPNTMIPLRGGSKTLTSFYQLAVSKDSLVSYLPFIGRAYNAPLPGENEFDFTSTSFDYKIKDHKKNGWDIMIKPKDHVNVQQFLLRVFDNGSASLNVTSLNRDPVSYSGHISDHR